jgi:hypothetical protein
MRTVDTKVYTLAASTSHRTVVLPRAPMTHHEARVMLSKFTKNPQRHVYIVER